MHAGCFHFETDSSALQQDLPPRRTEFLLVDAALAAKPVQHVQPRLDVVLARGGGALRLGRSRGGGQGCLPACRGCRLVVVASIGTGRTRAPLAGAG